MRRLLLILIIPAITFLGSCKKFNDVKPAETEKTINNLIVPADFDWKTTQTIDLVVTLPES